MTNVVRVAWLALAVTPGGLTADTPVGMVVAWTGWAVVAIAVIVLHPLSLSIVRFVAPLLAAAEIASLTSIDVPTAVALMRLEDPSASRYVGHVVAVTACLVTVVLSFRATYGAAHVQAAAYGHERRHLLRPPVAVLPPLGLLWCVGAIAGLVAVRSDELMLAFAVSTVCIVITTFAVWRSLVLTRRWLVFVPAGIAVHDPLMLRDTFMVRSHDVRGLEPAASTTEAFDATGTTWGTALELRLSHPHDVSLGQFGARMTKTLDRLHVTALLVAPSRPAMALADSAGARTL